jgi:hypothetical protein
VGVTGIVQKGGAEMENLETYTSVLVVLSAAILLVTGGLAKNQLVWKRRTPVTVRLHRRRSR